MTEAELLERISLLVNLSAGLLGVSVTLVALIPTLVELARLKAPDFISKARKEIGMRQIMMSLSATVVAFGLSLVLSLIGIFLLTPGWLWSSLFAFVIGVLILIASALIVASAVKNVI
jgi:hypothetical protein